MARNESRDDEEESQAGNDDATDDDDLDDSDYDDDDGDIDFDDDGDNQVVPWGSTPPPPAASSTSSDEVSNDGRYGRRSVGAVSLKRTRDNASDLRSLVHTLFFIILFDFWSENYAFPSGFPSSTAKICANLYHRTISAV